MYCTYVQYLRTVRLYVQYLCLRTVHFALLVWGENFFDLHILSFTPLHCVSLKYVQEENSVLL
jgi:hypothetical protein